MAVIRVDIDSHPEPVAALPDLDRVDGPVIVMIHGYKYQPGHPVHCPNPRHPGCFRKGVGRLQSRSYRPKLRSVHAIESGGRPWHLDSKHYFAHLGHQVSRARHDLLGTDFKVQAARLPRR